MRRLLKFLHTLGAAGFMGGAAVVAVVLMRAPAHAGAGGYAPLLDAMAKVAAWVIGPSMLLTVVAGLLAIVATPAFQNAAWVWAKAATGILVLEGGLHVLGPLGEEAKRAAAEAAAEAAAGSAVRTGAAAIAAAGAGDPAGVVRLFAAEVNTLWVLLAVSAANIALAIWKPRMPSLPF